MTKSVLRFSAASALLLAASLSAPGMALAQSDTTPPPVTSTTTTSAGSGAGLGVGAAAFVGGLSGLNAVYDLPRFHLEGLLAFSSLDPPGPGPTITRFQIGARGWYHLHEGSHSDFSLGGGFGLRTASGGGGPSSTATLLEPGMQARVWLTPNFTINATAGFSFVFGDNVDGVSTGFVLDAQLLSGLGFTYFFR